MNPLQPKKNGAGLKKKVKESNAEREVKSMSKSAQGWGRDRGGGEAFGGYLVIKFKKIQVHDFNFSLFLAKASRAAGGRLVVSRITAYEMSCRSLSQCLDDIIGMEMC